MTHYKWYDYKHAHTTYRKQLTNNTKQTDKTKIRNKEKKKEKKKETNTNKKKTKQNDKNKNQHPPTPPTHPPRPPLQKKEEKKATKYSRCRRHTSDPYKSKHCHIWLNTHYWRGEEVGGWGVGEESLHLHLCS